MTDNLRGIIAVLIASDRVRAQRRLVKLVSAELPSGEIIVVRGVLATILLTAGVVALGATRPISILMTRMMLHAPCRGRRGHDFHRLSLRYVPLATVNTVLQATPLLVTAGAAIFYGERVGLPRWMAALTGFAGVLLIVKPGNAHMGTAAYVVLIALAFTTMRDLTTRGLERDIPSIFVAAVSAVVITLAGFLVAPFDTAWTMPTPGAWGLMMGIGRLPVHRHTPSSSSRCARARSRWLRPFAMSPPPLSRCCWLLVVGRYARHAGLSRHCAGRRRGPLHVAS